MSEPIEQRRRELLVAAEDFDPFAEREIGGDDDAPSLVTIGEEIEEQLAACAVERHKPQLIEHEQVDGEKPSLKPPELARR